jgi:hypothetical protein
VTYGMDYFAQFSLHKANLCCRRVLREEVASAFRNASACSEDLDKEVKVSSNSVPSTSMALVVPQHPVLRPQRAVKNLALEMVLWGNETESTKIQSTTDPRRRSTSAASHQHSIDSTDTGINDQFYPRDRRGIPRAEAPTTLNFRPRRSAVDLSEPRMVKERHDFGEKLSVLRRPSQHSHDGQTKPYQSAICSEALLEAGIPFDEDEGIPYFSGGNFLEEEIQNLVRRTEQIEKEEAASTKFVSELLQETRAESRKSPPTQAPNLRASNARQYYDSDDSADTFARIDPLGRRTSREYWADYGRHGAGSRKAPPTQAPKRRAYAAGKHYDSDNSATRAHGAGEYYDSDDSADTLARIDPRSRRTSREYRADYEQHGAGRIVTDCAKASASAVVALRRYMRGYGGL